MTQPLEVYLVSYNTELPEGVYHYNYMKHLLEILPCKEIKSLNEGIRMANKPVLIILITALYSK